MNPEQLLVEIRDANLTYLMLAQNLIRTDRPEALFRLGLSEDAADMIDALSPSQVLKTASTNMLLCRFRVDDDLVWNLLTNHGLDQAPSRAHDVADSHIDARRSAVRSDVNVAERSSQTNGQMNSLTKNLKNGSTVSVKPDMRCDRGSASRMHASILMAGRFSEVL